MMEYQFFRVGLDEVEGLLREWCGTSGYRVHTFQVTGAVANILLERGAF